MSATVHVVVPEVVDDPTRPSGGNTYDRRICSSLRTLGWSVHERTVPGAWPSPDARARAALRALMAGLPDDAVVLLDGLIASAAPDALVPEAGRLRLVVLVHMPLGAGGGSHREVADAGARECEALSAALAVVTTSEWTRGWLLERYPLQPEAVRVAEPGVDVADPAVASTHGSRLVCVAAVTRPKGHDVLLAALAAIRELRWSCVCVGSVTNDPVWVEHLEGQARDVGISARVSWAGALRGEDLEDAYARADLLVHPSRAETYGMVVTEALARGVPVLATAVGGQAEALGRGSDGTLPGALVAPDDPAALADALRDWLGDPTLRGRFRRAASERRETLRSWSDPAADLARVLSEVAA